MNRLERMSAILVRLQSRSNVTAREIADQFGVSLRTVYRDIRSLEESGVPVCGEAGLGYSLVEGFKLPPLMFSTEEAISFLMAEKLVKNLTDGDTYGHYSSGMDKIRAVLRSGDQNIVEDFDTYIKVAAPIRISPSTHIRFLQPLMDGVLQERCIFIEYKAGYNQQISKRVVEPLGIFFRDHNWYLLAWCRKREDYRTFNMSRILDINLEGSVFDREHPSLTALAEELYESQKEYEIVVEIDADFLQFINTSKYLHDLYSEEKQGDKYILKFLSSSPDFFVRWFMSFADRARIVSPPEIAEMADQILGDINKRHDPD